MIETKSEITSNESIICESKKHWIVYLFPSFMIVLGLFFVLTTLKYYIIAGTIIIAFSILKILGYKSSKWILTEKNLIIKSGFLPWRKSYFDIPIDTIFEAFYKHGLLSNIFRYGHLYIRRTEGSTSAFDTPVMIKHKEITGKINAMVRELKNSIPNNVVSQQHKPYYADELIKLTELRRQGVLNDEEFEQMKQNLIN